MDDRLTIHPERAEALARVLASMACDLSERSHRVAALLAAHGEDLRPAVAIAQAATTLLDGAVELHRVVTQVRAWDAAGGRPGGRVMVLGGPLTASHLAPEAAHAAARAVAASYRRGGAAALVGVDPAWLDDAVFAATLLELLGPETVAGELERLASAWTYPRSSVERSEPTAVTSVLATLLATTTRMGPPAFTPQELARAAGALDVSPAVIGLLFLEPRLWEPGYLASLVEEIVVPISAAVIDRGVVHEPPWFGTPGDAVDGRALILSAAAALPAAARRIVGSQDIEVLLDARADLLDGGASVGRLLVAAVAPATEDEVDESAPLVIGVVEAVVEVDERSAIPVGVRAELGALAAPWIGGFGTTDLTAFGVPHPLPAMDADVAHRYLELAMAHDRAALQVEAGVLGWTRAMLARVGPTSEPLLVKQVADVLHAVADAKRAHQLRELRASDSDAERLREHVDLAMNVLTLPARTSPASEATTVVVVAGTSHLLEDALPPTDRELAHLRGLPAMLAEDQWATQYLVAAALWENRADNGLFAPVVGPPAPGQAEPPSGRLFLDDDGELRPYVRLGAAARADFERWLYELDHAGATVAHFVNAAGAEYGGSGG